MSRKNSIGVNVVEMYHYWLRQYSSYRQLEALFDIANQHVSNQLDRVRQAIVTKIYHVVAGFGTQHDVSIDNFEEQYSTELSRLMSEKFFCASVVLGSVNAYFY